MNFCGNLGHKIEKEAIMRFFHNVFMNKENKMTHVLAVGGTIFLGGSTCLIQRRDVGVQTCLVVTINLVTLCVIRVVLSKHHICLVIEVLDPNELFQVQTKRKKWIIFSTANLDCA